MLAALLVGLSAIPATPGRAEPVPIDNAPLPLWPGVHRGQLPNGLSYYLRRHGAPAKRAYLWLVVNAGAVDEDDDQKGLAHFVEHMAFQSTRHFPRPQIIDRLTSFGMRFGADLNAYTSPDETVFQLMVPTDQLGAVDSGLAILRDFADGAVLDAAEIEAERRVVHEEWRLRRSANQRLADVHRPIAFAGTRYADRTPIGEVETIDHAPPEALRRFYRDWYRPELMAVIVVGTIDPAMVQAQIEAKFGSMQNPPHPRPKAAQRPPRSDGTRVVIGADPETTGTEIEIRHMIATRPTDNRRAIRQSLIEELWELIMKSRLAATARRDEAQLVSATTANGTLNRGIDALVVNATVKPGHVEDGLRALLTELARAERHGFLPAELDAARAEHQRRLAHVLMSSGNQSSQKYVEELIRHHLAHENLLGVAPETVLSEQLLTTITLDDVNHAARAFGGNATRTIWVTGPDARTLPSASTVEGIIAAIAKTEVAPPMGATPRGALMPQLPTPGKIVGEREWKTINTVDWLLSNGVRVRVRPSRDPLDEVRIDGQSPGGLATVSDADLAAARLAPALVEAAGVSELSAADLQHTLSGKLVTLTTAIEDSRETLSGKTTPDDVELLLQWIHQRMTTLRRDPAAVETWRRARAQTEADVALDPERTFVRMVDAASFGDHPRHQPLTAKDVETVDVERAYAIYRDRFGDASDFTFVVTGNVDLKTLRPWVERYLGSLPTTNRHETERDLQIRRVPGVVKRVWKLGTAPRARVSLLFHGDEPWTRESMADLDNVAALLRERLRETLREEMGGVYGVHVGNQLSRAPHGARAVSIEFACDPARVDELVKRVFEETRRLAQEGPSAISLARLGAEWKRTRETSWPWATWLGEAARFDEAPTKYVDTSLRNTRLTSATVKAAAQRMLDEHQYFEAVLLPR